jgi:type VI protein secretion system component VasF
MADTDIETKGTDSAGLAPRALVSEIERTRADLARTIDQIADRVAPGNVARRTADRAKERLSQVDPLLGGAVVLAAASVTCYMLWRRLRK